MNVERSLVTAQPGTGLAIDFSGKWKNELGSTMTLAQAGNVLNGTYDIKVSSQVGTTVGHLRGFCDGDVISFIVHWRDFQAITTWVGQVGGDEVTMETLWQMTKVDEGSEWASINAGSDRFERAA